VRDDSIPAKVVMDDASVVEGLCEADCKDLDIGDVVQFERFGFARLDSIEDGEMIFYFAHN
jgi:glutamyl-tRNA synthetase